MQMIAVFVAENLIHYEDKKEKVIECGKKKRYREVCTYVHKSV